MENNSKFPLVTICIPAYNHERYVQSAIRSVLDQDYPRIEILVLDDGSTDSTWSKIEELREECERRFERVVFLSRENKGVSATCQELIAMAQGDFVGFLSSDDVYLPGAILNLIRPMIENSAIGLCVGINRLIDAEGRRCYWGRGLEVIRDESKAIYRTFDDYIRKSKHIDFESDDFGSYATLLRGNHVPNGFLVRRELYSRVWPYDKDAPLEDWWSHLQFSKIAKYCHIPVETFGYRWHGANTAAQEKRMYMMWWRTGQRERENVAANYPDLLPVFESNFNLPKHIVGPFYLRKTGAGKQIVITVGRLQIPVTPRFYLSTKDLFRFIWK